MTESELQAAWARVTHAEPEPGIEALSRDIADVQESWRETAAPRTHASSRTASAADEVHWEAAAAAAAKGEEDASVAVKDEEAAGEPHWAAAASASTAHRALVLAAGVAHARRLFLGEDEAFNA